MQPFTFLISSGRNALQGVSPTRISYKYIPFLGRYRSLTSHIYSNRQGDRYIVYVSLSRLPCNHRIDRESSHFYPKRSISTESKERSSANVGLVHASNQKESMLAEREISADQLAMNSQSSPSIRVEDIDLEAMEKHVKAQIKRDRGVLMYISYAATDVGSGLIRHLDGLLEVMYNLFPNNFPDPETAHKAVMWLASKGYLPVDYDRDDPALSVVIKGVTFHTPVGLAAGFDKHAKAPLGFCKMGFGFVEVGSVTPKPQAGNPDRPRIFRLSEDNAIINRCGFNSEGLDVVERRLENVSVDRWHDHLSRRCVLGINLGKNKDTVHAEDDIQEGIHRIGRFADYLVINLSSPNTKGLRLLQQREHLKKIIQTAQNAIKELEKKEEIYNRDQKSKYINEKNVKNLNEKNYAVGEKIYQNNINDKRDESNINAKNGKNTINENEKESVDAKMEKDSGTDVHTPDIRQKSIDFFPNQTGKPPLLFIKIAPDLTRQEKEDIAQVALETGLDGLIVTNTTISRPSTLKNKFKGESGGLSGRPLKELAQQCVFDLYKLTDGRVAIISSGGIENGLDAYKRIRAGASAVEIYSSLIYRGPVVARRIKDELLTILNQTGIYNVQDAIGLDHKPPPKIRVVKPTFE